MDRPSEQWLSQKQSCADTKEEQRRKFVFENVRRLDLMAHEEGLDTFELLKQIRAENHNDKPHESLVHPKTELLLQKDRIPSALKKKAGQDEQLGTESRNRAESTAQVKERQDFEFEHRKHMLQLEGDHVFDHQRRMQQQLENHRTAIADAECDFLRDKNKIELEHARKLKAITDGTYVGQSSQEL